MVIMAVQLGQQIIKGMALLDQPDFSGTPDLTNAKIIRHYTNHIHWCPCNILIPFSH